MNTGIKAPEGMGIVVETADIQNCGTQTGWRWDWEREREIFRPLLYLLQGDAHPAVDTQGEGGGWGLRGIPS